MSCRSTPANYAATTEARKCSTLLDDAQVQSLFHALKREARTVDTSAGPDSAAFQDWIERSVTRVRSEPQLNGPAGERIVASLFLAEDDDLPDGETWHALRNIRAATDLAEARLSEVFSLAGRAFLTDPGEVRAAFDKWRAADDGAFEDFPAPDPAYRLDRMAGMPTDDRTARALRKLGYEMYLAEPLPVFVYGTLRTGGHNSHLMDGAQAHVQTARADGIAIYGGTHGFPYAARHEDPSAVTVGEIVWLTSDDTGRRSRMYLDHLEGFHSDHPSDSHYQRTRRTVRTVEPDGTEREHVAWVYLAEGWAKARLHENDRIEHGDWFIATGRSSR